jgi:exoribonuclease R
VPYSRIDVRDSATAQLALALAALKTEFKLPAEFPAEVLAETRRAIADQVLPELDLSAWPFLTIDPPGSQDLDQAMFLERTGQGYSVHYAIAEVPSFVRPGGTLDAETRRRGQTVYTPDGRVPLHPAELSEGAASLLAHQLRAAFVWDIELDPRGSVTGAAVRRARVRSVAKLGYEQAQEMLDGGTAPQEIHGTLELLKEIGLKRIALEHQRGGASLNVPRQEVEFDGGTYRLVFRPALPVEDWNAQISLLTGMAAATIMLEGKVGILRTMPEPDEAALTTFRHQSQALGRPWPEDLAYGDFLRTLDTSDPRQLALMHAAASLFRGAGYVAFDGELPEKTAQAAVAAPYAHTTAPLRRLVDRFVLVICAALCEGAEVPGWARLALPQLPALMMASDQQANAVDRAALDTVEAAVLSSRIGHRFDAVVVAGPRSNGKGSGNGSPAAPRSTVQIQDPAITAYCEGELEPGSRATVTLVRADIPSRGVLFRAG